jgi:hypothetical protein
MDESDSRKFGRWGCLVALESGMDEGEMAGYHGE